MGELELRLVGTQSDLDECLLVRRAVFIVEQGVAPEDEFDEHDGDPAVVDSAVHVLGRLDGFPVAAARLILDAPPGGNAHIGRVAVLREMRGRGFGRAVMEELHAEARRRGIAGISLGAQLQALPFYERLGYEARGEVFLDVGIEHRMMDLELR